jgi:non-specific serine/threonine protein kinase
MIRVAVLAVVPFLFAASAWKQAKPLPVPRTEVAGARLGNEIVVVGGYLPDGKSSSRVDAYSPETNRWRKLPDLPVAVNHAMVASYRGRLYVVGGYGGELRASVFAAGRWRALPKLPSPRAAAGATIVRGKLYVVGGVGESGVARKMLVLDLKTMKWSSVRGPTPREHLAVTARKGFIYALAGREAGRGNFDYFERYSPGTRHWARLPRVPRTTGGTGAAAVGGRIISVGGEEPAGTIRTVYAYTVATRTWRRLPDMRTPRHGLAVVAFGKRVYAIAGGPRPGLYVSGANEFLTVG